MIVVIGANGMTGREIVRLALKQGHKIRPVVRDDNDTKHLEDLIQVNELSFADADHPESLKAVMKNAETVISCIDSRTAGWGAPRYNKFAAANVVKTANELGINKIIHLSVMGAYRWSPNALNRQSFHHDRWIKRSGAPWTMIRVSCYHDEIIHAHVMPPDGKKAHPIHPSSRYSPVSRKDAARAVMVLLPKLIPSRTWLIGGPETFGGEELKELVKPYLSGKGRRTARGRMPHGDFSVSKETTESMIGWVPEEKLIWSLAPSMRREARKEPFWSRIYTEKYSSDAGKNSNAIAHMGWELRHALHKLLSEDLSRIDIIIPKHSLNFEHAQLKDQGLGHIVHNSLMDEMSKVEVLDEEGKKRHCGSICFIYDDLSDTFEVWWDKSGEIPLQIWNRLDLGVRRRLHKHKKWGKDPKVLEFIASKHERTKI